MTLGEIRQRLLPSRKSDPKFDQYLRDLAHPGLKTVGAVEIAVPLLMMAGRAVTPGPLNAASWWQAVAMILVGVATALIASTRWSRRYPRLLTAASTWLAPTLLTWASIAGPARAPAMDDYVLTATTILILTVVTSVPLLPWEAMALGLSLEGMYIFSSWFAVGWEFPAIAAEGYAHHIFLVMLSFLATFIAAHNHEHRLAEFQSQQDALRAVEALTGAQLRAQLAESAISVGKMAAALSHEINSPLGTLRSSIETLISLTDRLVDAPPEQRDQLIRTRTELRHAIQESAARIDDVSLRLRRFVALAEADLKSADLNDLLSDVALLHDEELNRAHIRLELDLEKSLPPLTCRPQLLSSVFSILLSNAIQAVNGDGRIEIATRSRDSEVEVTVRDNGRGMRPEEADNIFDPSFKIEAGRVASGNWSLFNSRQIVYEHGGEIRLETAVGQGTAVYITLPVVVGPSRPTT